MLTLKGTHGTTRSRIKKINIEGFKLSGGLVGKGIYFWSDGPYAHDLAVAWWEFNCSRNSYKVDEDITCTVILAFFLIEDHEFLDLEQKVIKDELASIAKKRNLNIYDKRGASSVRALFIDRLEKRLSVKFKVIETSVTLPGKKFSNFYPLMLIGSPHCYIVLDTNCIQIEKISYIVD